MKGLTEREQKSMHLLKQLFDSYYNLPISVRALLEGVSIEQRIDEIPAILKMYKDDVRGEITSNVKLSMINQRGAGSVE